MKTTSVSSSIRKATFWLMFTVGAALPVSSVAQAEMLACQRLVEALAQEGRVALQGVEFDFNRASLRLDSLPALIAARDAILMLGGEWLIEGHTDNRGSHAYNQSLSEARALAVRDWLSASGVPSAHLTTLGFSFDRPLASNDTDEGRAQNRRVELVGSVTSDMLGAGGPGSIDACPQSLTTATSVQAEGAPPTPPITDWTGTGGQEWLPFSMLMPTGSGATQGWAGNRVEMPPGTQPQACQALCMAETECAAFSFEPAGSHFVENARCALIGYGTEVDLNRDNSYYDGGTYYASGLKPDALILTSESAVLAQQILEDMSEVAQLRETFSMTAPELYRSESWMDVGLSNAVAADRYTSYLNIAELGDYAFYWGNSKSSLYVRDMAEPTNGQIWVPEPGDYTLRYVIEHPTAGTHTIVEQLLSVRADAPSVTEEHAGTDAGTGSQASLSFAMVVVPGEAFSVSYTGPLFSGDWIDLITTGNDDDMSGGWSWGWATGEPVMLNAPVEEGEYTLRYVAEDPQAGRVVIASEILVVRAEPQLSTSMQVEATVLGEEADNMEVGDMQGIWWASVDMPGTSVDQSYFIVMELLQDADTDTLTGSFVTSPDIDLLPTLSGDAAGVIQGDRLNLSLTGADETVGIVFSGVEYGADAYRGQLLLTHEPLASPIGVILFKRAGPGEDWDGAPWMKGEEDGMAAALQMGQQVLQEMMNDLSGEDRAMVEMLSSMMGALAAPEGGNSPRSPMMPQLEGQPFEGLSADEALILLAPHLEK